MQGYLHKIGATFKQMTPRWFVIKDGFLYGYKVKGEVQPTSVTFLEGCFVEFNAADEDKSRFGFDVIISDGMGPVEGQDQRKTLFAKSAEERDAWMAAIGRAANIYNIDDFYEIGTKLGTGRFSTVHLGTHRITGKKYAIKIIDKTEMDHKEREALRAEIAVLKLVKHPNVIHLKNQFETRKLMYIVMHLCQGGDLFDRLIARKRFPEIVARSIIKKLLSVVKYLHDRGIVHRDLKPENIMMASVERDDDIVIGDFGLSKFAGPTEIMKLPCGTLAYVAPEVLTQTGYGQKVDIWSVGIISFLLLRGRLPFDSKKKDEIVAKTIAGRLDFSDEIWSRVSSDAKDFIMRCLNVDTEKRYNVEQALGHKWVLSYVDPFPDLTAKEQARHNQHVLELQLQHQQELLAQLFCTCPHNQATRNPMQHVNAGLSTPLSWSGTSSQLGAASVAAGLDKTVTLDAMPMPSFAASAGAGAPTLFNVVSGPDVQKAVAPTVSLLVPPPRVFSPTGMSTMSESPVLSPHYSAERCHICGLTMAPSRPGSPAPDPLTSATPPAPLSHSGASRPISRASTVGITNSSSHHNLQSLYQQNLTSYGHRGSLSVAPPSLGLSFREAMAGLPPASMRPHQSPPSSASGISTGQRPPVHPVVAPLSVPKTSSYGAPSSHTSAPVACGLRSRSPSLPVALPGGLTSVMEVPESPLTPARAPLPSPVPAFDSTPLILASVDGSPSVLASAVLNPGNAPTQSTVESVVSAEMTDIFVSPPNLSGMRVRRYGILHSVEFQLEYDTTRQINQRSRAR